MIQFEHVSYAYRVTDGEGNPQMRPALKNVSLSIRPGEFVVLTGGSGCGKTTICRLVNGLIPHYFEGELEGEVSLSGACVSAQPIYETAKRVGSVFQNPRSQFFNVDTTSELAFAAENQGRDPEQIRCDIADAAERLGLGPLLGRSMFALSGGEKQRIACGSVAVADSNVVVLDEPSSNLDMEGIEALRETLALWKSQGKTVIIAEHRLFFLRELADRVLVFRGGEVVRSLEAGEFAGLTAGQCAEMGLRATDLGSVSFCGQAAGGAPGASEVSGASGVPEVPGAPGAPGASGVPEVRLEGIRFNYSNDCGIDVSSLALPQGRITAVIGRNGAGKSTMARTLCGLSKRAKGTVVVGGERIPVAKMLPRCYMVMQDVNHQLFTDSVLEEVMISVAEDLPQETRERKAREALRLVDMGGFAEQHPMALSGGQKQRVAIASALAASKELLIFDEPTSGLDYGHMRQTAEVLEMLRALGKTVLVITHDLELIALSADHVVRMDQGHVAESYPVNDETLPRVTSFFLRQPS